MKDPTLRSEDFLRGDGFGFDASSLALYVTSDRGVPGGLPPVQRRARILHEYDHLVRSLGTSYGLVRYGLLTMFLTRFLDAYDRSGGVEELRSTWDAARSQLGSKATLDRLVQCLRTDSLESSHFAGHCFAEAARSLDGHNLHQASIVWLTGWAYYVAALTGTPIKNPEDVVGLLQRLWGTPPPAGELIYIDGKPLKSHDILEYLGVFLEVSYLASYLPTEPDFPAGLGAKTYLQALSAVKEFIPEGFVDEEGSMAREIEFALELALWVPLWPGMDLDDLPVHGIHLIPSYRLWFILDAWKRLGLPVTVGTRHEAEDMAPLAREWQRAVCEDLGWPLPDLIARRWREALKGIEEREELTEWFWNHPRSRRLDWSLDLLEALGERPISGALLAGNDFYERINFPVFVDMRLDPPLVAPNEGTDWPEADREFQRMDLLLFAASRAALDSDDWEDLPEDLRTEAQETWRQLMSPD